MFFFGDPKRKLSLLLEIQSSLVRGTLALYEGGRLKEALYSLDIEIPYIPHATSAYYVKTALRNLTEAIETSLKHLHLISEARPELRIPKRPDDVHFIMSSPWIISQPRNVVVPFGRKTAITEDRIKRILDEERMKMDFGQKLKVETIEEKIFEVRLNGYAIGDWHGKESDSLEVSYALSAGSSETIDKLRDIAIHSAGTKKVCFHSALILHYMRLRNLPSTPHSYALICIHGEQTDVMIVERQLCSFFGSFPVGINSVIRRITAAAGIDRRSAESLLTLHIGEHIDKEHGKATDSIMAAASAHWSDGLRKILGPTAPESRMPENAFIASGSHDEFFTRSFLSFKPESRLLPLPTSMANAYAQAINNASR